MKDHWPNQGQGQMPNDRSWQEKKKIPKDHVKKIKPWVDLFNKNT